nr:hypothetical protein [Lachnospiraceae bacterium]
VRVGAAPVPTEPENPEIPENPEAMDNGQTAAADSLVVITANGQIIRMAVTGIRECGRGSSGVKVVNVAKNDRVISASVVPGEDGEEEVAVEETEEGASAE